MERDLETSLVVVTRDPGLRRRLGEERDALFARGRPVTAQVGVQVELELVVLVVLVLLVVLVVLAVMVVLVVAMVVVLVIVVVNILHYSGCLGDGTFGI